MSTKLIGFEYHTTAVGNKRSSIFLNRIAKCFWRYGSSADLPGCVRPLSNCVLRDAVAIRCQSQLKSPAAAERHRRSTSSGNIAEPPVELPDGVCCKLLVLGRKVLAIAAYLPATYLERFWITHIARMQNV